MNRKTKRTTTLILALALALAAGAGAFFALRGGNGGGTELQVLLDGQKLTEAKVHPEAEEPLRVIVTVDGKEVADLPFGEEHVLTVRQGEKGENVLRVTADAVYMESADCEGQDCVQMEKVTRENLETRVMFGMIICLPHRVSVEVR